MPSATQIFVEILEKDADQWVEAAEACLALMPYVVGEVQKQQLFARAQGYRDRARNHRSLVAAVREKEALRGCAPSENSCNLKKS